MSYSKAEILSLANTLARMTLDPDTTTRYFDAIMQEIGFGRNPPLVDAELFSVSSGASSITIPSRAVRLLHAFVGSRKLSYTKDHELQAYDTTWRDNTTSTPFAYIDEESSARTFILFPIPNFSSGVMSFPTGTPLGLDFPTGSGTYFFSRIEENAVPDYLVIYIALRILALDFLRPSLYQNVDLAVICDQVAKLFWKLAGLK